MLMGKVALIERKFSRRFRVHPFGCGRGRIFHCGRRLPARDRCLRRRGRDPIDGDIVEIYFKKG